MTEPSGRAWCARFPTSVRMEDLADPFRPHVMGFVAAIRDGGGRVDISATYRPRERAYLMHWAWAIANGLPPKMCRPGDKPGVPVPPASVPPMDGVAIDWTHGGDTRAAVAAAKAMVAEYRMKVCAALDGRHCDRRAIDMRISWDGTLKIKNVHGTLLAISSMPRNGDNRDVQAVGKGYGVIKLLSDPPHWSDDGR